MLLKGRAFVDGIRRQLGGTQKVGRLIGVVGGRNPQRKDRPMGRVVGIGERAMMPLSECLAEVKTYADAVGGK